MSEATYGPVITLLGTVLFGWLLVQGFRSGTMTFEQPAVSLSGRGKDQPFRFWAVTALLSFLTASLALATIGQIFFPRVIGGCRPTSGRLPKCGINLIMVIRAISLATLILWLAFIGPPLVAAPLAAPDGFRPCLPTDPVAIIETRLAARLDGEFLGCFHSDPAVTSTKPTSPTITPTEYAFALALHDHEYSDEDLHELLSKVEQQWKDFAPLDGKLSDDYIGKLSGLIDARHKAGDAKLQSVQPILVKIDGDHNGYYTVTSIRTYVVAAGDASVTAAKVNADAVVVRNSRLVRLTIQRALTGSADVARTQADIDRWAKSIEQP